MVLDGIKLVRRIEITIASIESKKICKILDTAGVIDYTIVKNVTGKGERGRISDDLELADMGDDYITAICDDAQEDTVIAAIRPLLKRYGGMCTISDAKLVLH
jgi:nitrogen regulatory protein PII